MTADEERNRRRKAEKMAVVVVRAAAEVGAKLTPAHVDAVDWAGVAVCAGYEAASDRTVEVARGLLLKPEIRIQR